MIFVHKPQTSAFPLIVTVPHAGTVTPKTLLPAFFKTDFHFLNFDCDWYVDKLVESVPELGGYLLTTDTSRYVIDLNRDDKEWDASFVVGAAKSKNPKNLGLVAHKTTVGDPLLKKPLQQSELQDRIQNYYRPFHEQLVELITQIKKQFGFCLHIDAHSMPSKGESGHSDFGEQRADIVLGDRMGTSCSPRLTQFVEQYFVAAGLNVARNLPYQGGFITQNYGNPAQNIHTLQIEHNRKLYLNESTHEILPASFEALQKILHKLFTSVRNLKP